MKSKSIPVVFVPTWLAVNEAQLHEMLGLNDGRSVEAKKKAVYEFRVRHGIDRTVGGNFPLRKIQQAIEGDY